MDSTTTAYQKSDIGGMAPLDLVIKVYDGAIASYRDALRSYQAGENEAGHDHLEKAKKFVTHLYTTLDEENGGDIAANLGKLYSFVINETNVLAATKEPKKFDDVVGILDNLRQGWLDLRQQQNGLVENAPAPQQGSGIYTSA
jgi:flagellar protein FliS